MHAKFDEPNTQRGHDRPRNTPNYRSRGVRIRLFVLVSLIMLVLIAMQRVSDPQFWSFMGFEQDQREPLPAGRSGEKVDSRVRELPRSEANALPDSFQVPESAAPRPAEPESVLAGGEFRFTQQDGWEYVHGDLEESQRLLLHKILKNTRDRTELSGADLQQWNRLLPELDELWQEFHLENRRAVEQSTDTPDQEKRIWRATLGRSESHWSNRVKPTLALAAAGESLATKQLDLIDETQRLLDNIELKRVEDNTHLSRIREKNAWFRLFDQLNTLTAEQLSQAAATRVGFLQLFRQPKQYRGSLVTIRGTARLAYHVQAPSNIYGIQDYYGYEAYIGIHSLKCT